MSGTLSIARSHGGVIDELVAGTWHHPRTGERARIPNDNIVIAEALDGAEADLVAPLHRGQSLVVVADRFTYDVLGQRVRDRLRALGSVDSVVWETPRCSEEGVSELRALTRHADAVIAVGSGTVSDSVKYATFLDGKSYSVFPTSPMNAYTTPTASVSFGGFKRSVTAHAARGVFFDLSVLAKCPTRLITAAFADVVCRTTSQVDWLLSHLLLGTLYDDTAYALLAYDEATMLDRASDFTTGDIEALAVLTRIAAIMGLGTSFTGTTHSGSMAEHMMSHYIDMFAGDRHPGSSHGEQVGVATLTISALQNRILAADSPPELQPAAIPHARLAARYGAAMADEMARQADAKALDGRAVDAINRRWADDWQGFAAPLRQAMLPFERLWEPMTRAGAPRTATELGLDVDFYRDDIRDARFTRDRFSILDLAAGAGLLDAFAETAE
ncbi:MAG: iron-containing alcohol dehydrogenase [Alphaproteobacteria bacterium]